MILVVGSLIDCRSGRVAQAAAAARVRFVASGGDPADVRDANAFDWSAVRKLEGGWDGAARWAARACVLLVVVPTSPAGDLSRAVYQMAEAALAMGKPVLSAQTQDDAWVLRRVLSVTRDAAVLAALARGEKDPSNWKLAYGRVAGATP